LTGPRASRYNHVVVEHLFIVSRHEADLYKHLADEFASEPDVHVIVDRRVGERRRSTEEKPAIERRQGERRAQSHVTRQVNSIGYAFVRLDG
jgi:hypothetical protein